MSDSFSDKIQTQIREERERLLGEQERLKTESYDVYQQLKSLQTNCAHPNVVIGYKKFLVGALEPMKTVSCPDCGLNEIHLDLRDKTKPHKKRGRPSKNRN